MIVSYLVEHEEMSVEQALTTFAEMRPPGIYKDHYILELCKRYDGLPDGLVPVAKPEWCLVDAGITLSGKREKSRGRKVWCLPFVIYDMANSWSVRIFCFQSTFRRYATLCWRSTM